MAGERIVAVSVLMDIVIRGTEERVARKAHDSFCPVGPWIVAAGTPSIFDTAPP